MDLTGLGSRAGLYRACEHVEHSGPMCTADALPAAGRAIARAVRGLVSPEPGSGAPSTSGTSGLAPAVVPSPLAGGSGYQTVE